MSSHYSEYSRGSKGSRFSRRQRIKTQTNQNFAQQLDKLKMNDAMSAVSDKLSGMNINVDKAKSYGSEIENSHYSDDDYEEGEIEVSKEFKENVIRYVKLDDMIRQRQNEVKELTGLKNPCEEFILKYLEDIESGTIEINDGKLRRNKSEQKTPLSTDIIKSAIEKKVADPKTVEDIMKLMDELRPKKTRVNLKRTKTRAGNIGSTNSSANNSAKNSTKNSTKN